MEYIVKLENLTKQYGKHVVVDRVNLAIEKGHIYGLIGPNGAGKTTIMRMLAGLTEPSGGEMELFGDRKDLDYNRNRISFMIEAPYLDGGMTARENMEYIRFVRGVAEKKRIDELLEVVGLGTVGKKLVDKFSLGMKQRLGIAMALLSRPEIMVLDEPVNGLDPEGIVEVRKLLKKLSAEEGITILISSHILAELEELCTDFVILHEGKVVENLSAEELREKCRQYIAIKTDNIGETVAMLEQKLEIHDYKVVNGEEIRLFEQVEHPETVSKTITDSGYILTKFVVVEEELEQYYLSKVGDKNE